MTRPKRSHRRAARPWRASIALLFISTAAHAQQRAPTRVETVALQAMTLDQALASAHAHHPSMQLARSHVDVARAEAAIPRAQWLPAAGATAQLFAATTNNSTANTISSPYVDLPRIGATRVVRDGSTANWAPYASTLAAVGVNQEIYDFGRIAAQSAAADARIDVARARTGNAWLGIELGVREAYYAVLAARGVLTAAEDAYRRAAAHRDMARAWVDQGLRPRIELERAEADLARFDVGRIHAQGGLEEAQAEFAAAVGLEIPRLDAAGDATNIAPMPSLADALRQAGARDPLVREVLARIREQEARTHAIEAEMRPDLGLTASLNGRAGGALPSSGDAANLNGALPLIPNWDVGLVFNWPVFDATVWARRAASQRAEEALRAEVAVARHGLFAAIERAWLDVSLAESALPALERARAAAEANSAQAEARFRAGLGTSVELADAEALRTEAEIQLALGRFDIARARARFARAVAEGQ
jgi:outer membrane protein TolC